MKTKFENVKYKLAWMRHESSLKNGVDWIKIYEFDARLIKTSLSATTNLKVLLKIN